MRGALEVRRTERKTICPGGDLVVGVVILALALGALVATCTYLIRSGHRSAGYLVRI